MAIVKRFAGNAKITEESVRALRRLADTHTPKELARIYGLGLETVRRILRRDTWAWVESSMPELDETQSVEPLTEMEKKMADESLQRVLAATGMQHLQQAAAQHFRADALVDELAAGKPVNPLDE